MIRDGLDAVVIVSPENVYYVTGCRIITQTMIRDRMAIVLIPLADKPIFIVCEMERLQAEMESRIREMRFYTEFRDNPIDLLGTVLKERGLQKARLGIEMNYFPARDLYRLGKKMRHLKFRDSEKIFDAMRMIKSKEEIEILRMASRATEKCIYNAFDAAHCGDTELQIAKSMINNLVEYGADAVYCPCYFLVMGSGKRSIIAHAAPTSKRIMKGELIRVDFGGMFSGYVSDLAAVAVVGKPTDRQTRIYYKLVISHERVIEEIRPGISAAHLYDVCKETFRQNGLQLRVPHIGHSLGLNLHEAPMLQPFNTETIRRNMILNIEPSIVTADRVENYHIEDTVLVTNEGAELLTECQQELFKIK